MKQLKVTKFVLVLIFLSFLSYPSKGLAKLITSVIQKTSHQGVEQDSLIKSTQEIMEYFKNSAPSRGEGGIVKDSLSLRLEIPFDFNSAQLTESAKIQLANLAQAMQSEQYSGISLKLAGYTDARGSEEYNLRLSQRRVESAKNYLIRNYNILPGQIYAKGYGESNPIIKNAKTEAEYSVNRRVEISPWKQSETNNNNDSVLLTGNQPGQEESMGKPDQFEWGVFHVKSDGSEALIKNNGSTVLKSKDKYRLYLKPPKPSYIYIYQEDSNGNGSWLFPSKDIDIKNPLNNGDNWIPSRNVSFSLDNNTGTEAIYLVASSQQDLKLEDLIFDKNSYSVPRDTITVRIKMRGVAGSVVDESKHNAYMTEINGKNWDFYVEIKFKHE
jgi:outer membrane protein OmpA-like peptidoglycan-associated protein